MRCCARSLGLSFLLLICASLSARQKPVERPVPRELAQVMVKLGLLESEEAEDFHATPIQLADNAQTVILWPTPGSGWCGATGSCQVFIFQKMGNSYRSLLTDPIPVVKRVHVLNSFTNGYHDIQMDSEGGGISWELVVYRFDGKKYRLDRCFFKSFAVHEDANGEIKTSSRPTIERIKCPKE